MSAMLDALREQRAAMAAEITALLDGEPTTEALDTVEARTGEMKSLDERISNVEATEARAAEIVETRTVPAFGGAHITSEPLTYAEHGERSYFKDLANAQLRNDQRAWENLNRHDAEMRVEARAGMTRVDGAGGELQLAAVAA